MDENKKKVIDKVVQLTLGFLGALFGAIFGGQ